VAISNPEAGFRFHFNGEDCKEANELIVVVEAVGISSVGHKIGINSRFD
jgi:hypothetical protein